MLGAFPPSLEHCAAQRNIAARRNTNSIVIAAKRLGSLVRMRKQVICLKETRFASSQCVSDSHSRGVSDGHGRLKAQLTQELTQDRTLVKRNPKT